MQTHSSNKRGGIICTGRNIDFFIYNKRSQIYIINKRGPRISPCGASYIILSNSLDDKPALVVCKRFFIYEINTFNEVSSKP